MEPLFKHMPSSRKVLMHFLVMSALSCLLGPWLGPIFINWINPPQAWGNYSAGYTLLNMLIWGSACMMLLVFIYTGWLIAQGKKAWKKVQPKSWYN